ncbi:hypothetical protein R1sor_014124 [Riccia sorocarpa]|uniref:Uncharacterized protein n=1 Tax=Riccia sorocarpa TaxID=122646 RepID=A0ABD3HC89_9MARC
MRVIDIALKPSIAAERIRIKSGADTGAGNRRCGIQQGLASLLFIPGTWLVGMMGPVGVAARIQAMKENTGVGLGSGEIPHLSKLLSMLETLCGSVTEIKFSVLGLKSEVLALRSQVDKQSVDTKQQLQITTEEVKSEALHLKEELSSDFKAVTDLQQDLQRVGQCIDNQAADIRCMQKYAEEQTAEFSVQLKKLEQKVLAVRVAPSVPDLTPVLEHMDVKMQSYAEATRVAHTTLLQEQEKEKLAREARINNLRIVGLPEEDKENTKDVVLKFFQEELLVREPIVESAVRIGRGERGSRAILVRFGSAERRGRVVGNRRLLKGKGIWLDSDLTPMQAEKKRYELKKVKEAVSAGWIAYLRDGKAVITTWKREEDAIPK